MLAYICTHFLLSTVAFALNIKFNEATFITNRDFPGGPNGYFIGNQSTWTRFVGYVLYMIIAWLQDALLVSDIHCASITKTDTNAIVSFIDIGCSGIEITICF